MKDTPFVRMLYAAAGLEPPASKPGARGSAQPDVSGRVAYFRRRRAEAKGRGACVVCRRRIAAPGTSSCAACAEAREELYARHKRLGLCPSCGAPAAPNRVRCRACNARAAATNARRRREKRRAQP